MPAKILGGKPSRTAGAPCAPRNGSGAAAIPRAGAFTIRHIPKGRSSAVVASGQMIGGSLCLISYVSM